jgi:hypothetical protein
MRYCDGDWQRVLQIVAQAGANIEVVVCSRRGDHKLRIDVLEQGGYDVPAEPRSCTRRWLPSER